MTSEAYWLHEAEFYRQRIEWYRKELEKQNERVKMAEEALKATYENFGPEDPRAGRWERILLEYNRIRSTLQKDIANSEDSLEF